MMIFNHYHRDPKRRKFTPLQIQDKKRTLVGIRYSVGKVSQYLLRKIKINRHIRAVQKLRHKQDGQVTQTAKTLIFNGTGGGL